MTRHDATRDNDCSACPDNQFKEGYTNDLACTPKTQDCPEGEFWTQSKVGSADSKIKDNWCTSCPAHSFKKGRNKAQKCEDKRRTCGAKGGHEWALVEEDPRLGKAAKNKDDTVCVIKAQCIAGQKYVIPPNPFHCGMGD